MFYALVLEEMMHQVKLGVAPAGERRIAGVVSIGVGRGCYPAYGDDTRVGPDIWQRVERELVSGIERLYRIRHVAAVYAYPYA